MGEVLLATKLKNQFVINANSKQYLFWLIVFLFREQCKNKERL